MAGLSRYWKDWISRYTADSEYWYVPKGKSISDITTIQKQLKILTKYEGSPWRDSQKGYQADLKTAGLSQATAEDEDHRGRPMARMLSQVFSMLGFAWIDQDEAITITPAGEAFISSRNPAKIVGTQAIRYQISNPAAGGRTTQDIEIHPVPYLLEILLETKTLTKTEYVLFCAKSKNYGDFEDAVEGICEWRMLGPRQKAAVIRSLDAVTIDSGGKATRRSSIHNTIELNSSYAIAFWAASGVIAAERKDGETQLRIPRIKLSDAKGIVKRYQEDGQFISFATKKDWMAFYGDPQKPATKRTALTYYTDTVQLDMVRQVLDEMDTYTEREKRKYLSMIVSEETVEDILERNPELIEPGMKLLNRQLETEVGRIDLFGRDRNGIYTIIELKKGKSEDEVYGQLSRYMGWCKKTKARSNNVRGIIIAKQIGKKLWAAADAHDTKIDLMEYDLKMSIEKARRSAVA